MIIGQGAWRPILVALIKIRLSRARAPGGGGRRKRDGVPVVLWGDPRCHVILFHMTSLLEHPSLRPIRPENLQHGAEGWTTLLPASSTSFIGQRTGATSCSAGSKCCKRHPRTPSCRHSKQPATIGHDSRQRGTSGLMLRDDLFLEDPHIQSQQLPITSAKAAPAVVRAYEACEADSAELLRRARNETAAARRALSTQPLPIAAVLFFGTHTERLPAIRTAYAPYFASLVFMTLGARRPSSVGAGEHHHRCRAGLKSTYACVAEVAATFGSAPGIRGVLYLHFDMWIHPWRLGHLTTFRPSAGAAAAATSTSLDALWSLPPARIMIKANGPTRLLPLECFNATRPSEYEGLYTTPNRRGGVVPAWTWARDLPAARTAVRRACTSTGGGRESAACDPTRLCLGWADLYYVPRRMYTRFGQLARAFASGTANAELAVPTMMRILSEHGPLADRPPLLRAPCWGFCCSSTPCPELLVRHACGHRMRLDVPRMRQSFEHFLQV